MGNQTIASRFFDEAFIIYHEYANLANFHNLAFLYVYLIAVIVSGFHGVTVHADDEVSVFHIRGFNGVCRNIIKDVFSGSSRGKTLIIGICGTACVTDGLKFYDI